MKVLIVVEEKILADVINEMIEILFPNCYCKVALSPEEAFSCLDEEFFPVVISSYYLGSNFYNGADVLYKAKQQPGAKTVLIAVNPDIVYPGMKIENAEIDYILENGINFQQIRKTFSEIL